MQIRKKQWFHFLEMEGGHSPFKEITIGQMVL